MIENPFIFKVLDVSTGHMSREDSEALENEFNYGTAPVYELGEYGWLCYVGEMEDNWPSDQWSMAFRNVMAKAAELGCDYVRWDRDGREYPEFQSFDW